MSSQDYAEYAWAFDLLIDRPVQQECRTIAAWLADRGVVLGATLLDAGCGTGRYAMELSRHGYIVHGSDRSPELVVEALRSADSAASSASFAVGDLLESPLCRYDAILCRGVLNDFLDESDRASVFAVFNPALRPNGVLVLDVREWATHLLSGGTTPLLDGSGEIIVSDSVTTASPPSSVASARSFAR